MAMIHEKSLSSPKELYLTSNIFFGKENLGLKHSRRNVLDDICVTGEGNNILFLITIVSWEVTRNGSFKSKKMLPRLLDCKEYRQKPEQLK
jgi:hypothetical protein